MRTHSIFSTISAITILLGTAVSPAVAELKPFDEYNLYTDSPTSLATPQLKSPTAMRLDAPGTSELMTATMSLQRGNLTTGRKWLTLAAIKGNDTAQYLLASLMINESNGQNSAEVMQLLKKSSDQENIHAQFALASILYTGTITEQNLDLSFSLACKAAMKELAAAELLLSMHYFYGAGVDINPAQALLWAQKADKDGKTAPASYQEKLNSLSDTSNVLNNKISAKCNPEPTSGKQSKDEKNS